MDENNAADCDINKGNIFYGPLSVSGVNPFSDHPVSSLHCTVSCMKDLWSVSRLEVVWSRPLRSLVLSWPQVPAALKLTKHVFMLASKSQNSEWFFVLFFCF